MTTLSYTVPVPGTDLNAIADPEIATALTSILAWANGNISTGNIATSAAIVRAQLAGGFGNLIWTPVSTTTSAVDGHYYIVTSAVTVTLPSPAANRTVGVINNVAGVVTITASSGSIFGLGVATSNIFLGQSFSYVVLVADGTNWVIAAGQQDTGWEALSLSANVSAGSGYTPAARLVGDRVYLCGTPTASPAVTSWATIPGGLRPSATVNLGAYIAPTVTVAPSGVLASNTSNTVLPLDALSYRLG